MQALDFNTGWYVAKTGEAPRSVILPHAAMIHEQMDPNHIGGSKHGFFPGGIYEYTKTFVVPADWRHKNVAFHFGSVYKNATVTLNGEKLGFHPYGYVPFTLCAEEHLRYGEENVLKVVADNSNLPNSRWYTGSGIYRPVQLLLANKTHILYQGVKITTLSYAPARIRVQTQATGGQVSFEILERDTVVAQGSGTDATVDIPGGKLWSDETPNLYTCRVTLTENGTVQDVAEVKFGIRKIEWNHKGLFINGRETLLHRFKNLLFQCIGAGAGFPLRGIGNARVTVYGRDNLDIGTLRLYPRQAPVEHKAVMHQKGVVYNGHGLQDRGGRLDKLCVNPKGTERAGESLLGHGGAENGTDEVDIRQGIVDILGSRQPDKGSGIGVEPRQAVIQAVLLNLLFTAACRKEGFQGFRIGALVEIRRISPS